MYLHSTLSNFIVAVKEGSRCLFVDTREGTSVERRSDECDKKFFFEYNVGRRRVHGAKNATSTQPMCNVLSSTGKSVPYT